MKAQVIPAGKVVLRPKRREDARDDFTWRCDEELAALDATSPLKLSFEWFVSSYEDDLKYASPWSLRFGIDTVEGKHIGNCMCYDINTDTGEAELGIMIGDRDYWSQAYGYHTMIALIEHMFTAGDMWRLRLHTLDWNRRAQRCFSKCGFREVGSIHRNGWELVRMELLRDQWLTIRESRLAELEERYMAKEVNQ